MSNKWDEFQITPSKKFGYEVPTYIPSIYREYRGEIFTTFHSGAHPVMTKIGEGNEVHGRFSKSYKGVLRGLHYDNKTWKLVQAAVGDIYLIVLDMRKNSPTFGEWESFMITEKDRNQVLDWIDKMIFIIQFARIIVLSLEFYIFDTRLMYATDRSLNLLNNVIIVAVYLNILI